MLGFWQTIPVRVNKSETIVDLIRASKRASQSNDGDRLTSNTHGLNWSSTKISNPNSS